VDVNPLHCHRRDQRRCGLESGNRQTFCSVPHGGG